MIFMRHEANMSTLSVNYDSDAASDERYAPCGRHWHGYFCLVSPEKNLTDIIKNLDRRRNLHEPKSKQIFKLLDHHLNHRSDYPQNYYYKSNNSHIITDQFQSWKYGSRRCANQN